MIYRKSITQTIYSIIIFLSLFQECLEWAESVCRRCGLDRSTVDLWPFSSTTGTSLLQFTHQHLCHILGPQHGHLFHRELQALIKRTARGTWETLLPEHIHRCAFVPVISCFYFLPHRNSVKFKVLMFSILFMTCLHENVYKVLIYIRKNFLLLSFNSEYSSFLGA